jgi:exopolysaccharide biosynthesis polyprenyl glycosylphosphotransferase
MDVLAFFSAGIVSFYIRIHSTESIGPIIYHLTRREFFVVIIRVLPVLLIVFALLGLYNLKGTRRFIHEFNRIVVGISFGVLSAIVLFFFNQQIFPSRFIILAGWALSIVFVIIGRLILKTVQEILFARGYGLHRLVIVNGSGLESEVIEQVLKDRSHGYKVVAELHYRENIMGELESLYRENSFDEIMQANPEVGDSANLQLVEFARNKGLEFSFVPNMFQVQRNAIELNNFHGVPVISLKNTPLDGWGKVAKRALDILTSALCLIITSPVFLFLAIAIKLDSAGRIIYSAPRGGRGRDFAFYKFRSMHTHLSVGEEYGGEDAEKIRQELWKNNERGGTDGPFLKIKDDPRVTRIGKFMRKTKLDELPQFWNVLKGDMSMVGPRAHVLDEVGRYRDRYRRMFSIKPGIFGLSQLAQITWPDLPFEEEIRLNTYYIENWSLWWDLKILLKTFYMLFFAPKPNDDY